MNLNFIIDNKSITRFSYDKRIDMEVATDDYYNQYYYRNFKYLDNFNSTDNTIAVHTDKNGNTYDANIKKIIKPIEDLYTPTNVATFLQPVYDSINNNGGSMYMSSTANSRTITFSNIVVPISSDKFIIRFAPLFDYKQISLLDLETDTIKTHDYMILTISVYVHNLLFIELGFNTDGNIYINNDRNREITDSRNKVDISETPFQLLKTKVLYNSFYIILDRDFADVRFYDPYYYIYDEELYMTIPKLSKEYNEYLFTKQGNKEYEIKYIENNIDFLTVYKKCKYNNKLDVNGNQLVNVVINSKYMDNISIGYFINKYKNNRSKNFKEKYLIYYTNAKFEKRKNHLEYIKMKLKQKIEDAINSKINNFYSNNNTNSEFGLDNSLALREYFNNLCEYFKKEITDQVLIEIDNCFNDKIYKIEEYLKENFITQMIDNKHQYTDKISNLIILRTDVTSLLRALPLGRVLPNNDTDGFNVIKLEDGTEVKETSTLTEIHESLLLKYRKLLIVDIYNQIFNIVINKVNDINITFNNQEMSYFIEKTFGVGATDGNGKYIRPIQMTNPSGITEENVHNFDKIDYGEKGYSFQKSNKPMYDGVNYNNLQSQPLMEYIIQIITNELLNIYLLIIPDLTISEKAQIEDSIISELSKSYSVTHDTYKYNIYLDKFQMLYLVPYDKNKDIKGITLENKENKTFEVQYEQDDNEYDYTIDTIFNISIPDKIKFKDVMDNYKLSETNIAVEQSDMHIINEKKEND